MTFDIEIQANTVPIFTPVIPDYMYDVGDSIAITMVGVDPDAGAVMTYSVVKDTPSV